MTLYKSHFACFECQKTFKRRLLKDIQGGISQLDEEVPAKCPDCNVLMANMGFDFKAPKKNDNKAWGHLATLYGVGIAFHSCGCTGPGYVPRDKKELIEHFIAIKNEYLEHQQFWARRREDPVTQSEIAKDAHHNGAFLYSIPRNMKSGTKNNIKYEAKQAQVYWHGKANEVAQKILSIANANSA